MRQGGKIATAVALDGGEPDLWVEPFSGGMGSAACAMRAFPKAKFILNDNNAALQTMWRRLLGGWEPPQDCPTDEEYHRYKEIQDPDDPMTAYVGFGWSFGGKWFAGLAKPNLNKPGGRDHGPLGGTVRKSRLLRRRDVQITTGDWKDVVYPPGSVVYYDPPYAGKTKQHRGVLYVDPREIEEKAATRPDCRHYASEFGEVFRGRVVLDMGNTDMLVNGGEKKNASELLVRL